MSAALRRLVSAGALSLLVVTLGCPEAEPPTPKEAARSQAVLLDWFECEECDAGELEAVAELGDATVDLLGAVVVRGLAPAARARLEDQLLERYRAREAYGEQYPALAPRMDRETFVAHHLGSRDSQYRERAVLALQRIATRAARDALRAAQGQTGHAGIEREIARALTEM